MRAGARLLLAVAALAGAVGILEGVLRAFPKLLPPRLANAVYSRYDFTPTGIYFEESRSRMRFMKPGFQTTNYWNGYFWTHRTDENGFRNPHADLPKEVLLLGDSLIYGHGVDEERTVAHVLREKLGVAAYNMARQGDDLHAYYVLARLYLERFRPRVVLLFSFLNDFYEVEAQLGRELVETAPEIDSYDYREIYGNVMRLRDRDDVTFLKDARHRLRSYKLFRYLRERVRAGIENGTAGAARNVNEASRGSVGVALELDPTAGIGRYYRRLLADLDRRCRRIGAQLVVIHLAVGDPETADRVHGFLSRLSRKWGIAYRSTEGIFSSGSFLEGDGHFSEQGHRELAGFVARVLRQIDQTGES